MGQWGEWRWLLLNDMNAQKYSHGVKYACTLNTSNIFNVLHECIHHYCQCKQYAYKKLYPHWLGIIQIKESNNQSGYTDIRWWWWWWLIVQF